MEYIYILKLENHKFYVGKTSLDVNDRFLQHQKGAGSSWTRLYKPIEILKKFKSEHMFDEDKYVFEYMHYYGIDNVRGGSFSCEDLCEDEYFVLDKILKHGSGACFNCGKFDHLVSKCKACTRCGRDSHKENNCYAKTHRDGGILVRQ